MLLLQIILGSSLAAAFAAAIAGLLTDPMCIYRTRVLTRFLLWAMWISVGMAIMTLCIAMVIQASASF